MARQRVKEGIEITRDKEKEWFDSITVIGAMERHDLSMKLKELGGDSLEEEVSAGIIPTKRRLGWMSKEPKPWMYTSHAFGFIDPHVPPVKGAVEIKHVGDMGYDKDLKNSKVRITLDRLIAFDYPGGGTHSILVDFYARNNLSQETEHLHYNQLYTARQRQQIGGINIPIFVGLETGSEGVDIKCITVNVNNEEDEKHLGFLSSDVFKTGLKLMGTINPIVPVLSNLVTGLTEMILKRNRNVAVQKFEMGVDFADSLTGARLKQGSYIAVQVPDAEKWRWKDWEYLSSSGQIVSRKDHSTGIPYNYLVFGVNKL